MPPKSACLTTSLLVRCVPPNVTAQVLKGKSTRPEDRGAMVCEEKARLAMEYEAATSAFSQAVKELHHRIGISPKRRISAA
jgi:hypothetical protein